MTWIGWIIGLLGLSSFIGLLWWIYKQGKQIKGAEYDKERVILLEKHQRSINNWAKEVDRLADESNKLKDRLRADPSLPNVLRVLSDAHGPDDLPDASKPDTT